MTKRFVYFASVASVALGMASAPSAQAAFVVAFTEEGSNVAEAGSGTIDLTDLTFRETLPGELTQAAVNPSLPGYVSGTSDATAVYSGGVSGPTSWGAGGITTANSTFGDIVGLNHTSEFFLLVPDGYASSSVLSTNATYVDASFASLGLTPGIYVYRWGSGANADTLTIEVGSAPGSPVPEPATWAMMLLGFATFGFAGRRAAVRLA